MTEKNFGQCIGKLGMAPSDEDQSQVFDLDRRKVRKNWHFNRLINDVYESAVSAQPIGHLELFIVSANIDYVVTFVDVQILGRSYPHKEHFNGIDFAPFDGYKLGVDQEHCLLKYDSNALFLLDNDSKAGTFLNAARLNPHKPYLVKNDDMIRLGQLEFNIHIHLY